MITYLPLGFSSHPKSLFHMGACGLVQRILDSRSKGSGVQFPLLVGRTCCSIQLLPTQQLWVPGGRELLLSASCIHTCMTCALYSPREMTLLKWCVSYTRERNWLVQYGIDIYLTLNYIPFTSFPTITTTMHKFCPHTHSRGLERTSQRHSFGSKFGNVQTEHCHH